MAKSIPDSSKNRWSELVEIIEEARRQYYVLDSPTISDDEYDNDDLVEQKIAEDEYLLSARHEIDYLNDKYGWDLPYGDFETLSGLILSLTENLPNKGEFVSFGKYTFTIVSKEAHRIETVRLKINESENF
mgnify:CR=1 FL=1